MSDADEDDLYAAMDWVLERQEVIEKKLAARHLQNDGLALYDLHPAVAHHHKLLDSEPLLHLFYLRQERFGIARVALEDGYRHRDTAFVGQ